MSCGACEGIERQFDRGKADKELRRFHRRGPLANTRRLIEELRTRAREGDSLLDIGGGVGAIHHVLLDADVRTAVHLDASSGYIDVARGEAARRGHAGRVQFVHGDFVEIAGNLAPADIVTLDRVICCYPDMDAMVARAADKTRRLLGAVYPRDAWWVRVALALANTRSRLRKSAFRVYLHPPTAIEAKLDAHGLRRTSLRRTIVWEIATFE
jgi:methyltransferase family protein